MNSQDRFNFFLSLAHKGKDKDKDKDKDFSEPDSIKTCTM